MQSDTQAVIATMDAAAQLHGLPTYTELVSIAKAAMPLHRTRMIKLVNELNPYPEHVQKKLMAESIWLDAKADYDNADAALKKLEAAHG